MLSLDLNWEPVSKGSYTKLVCEQNKHCKHFLSNVKSADVDNLTTCAQQNKEMYLVLADISLNL